MATAISASALNNPDNQSVKAAAYNDAHTKLLTKMVLQLIDLVIMLQIRKIILID